MTSKRGSAVQCESLANDRSRLFGQLAGVDVSYQPAFRGFQNGIGEFDVSYSMTFRYRTGRVFRESACESYKVRKDSGRWVIIENQDYKPC